MKNLITTAAIALCVCAPAPHLLAEDDTSRGVTLNNNGTFSYQGYLEENGQPANGNFSFQFIAYEQPFGDDWISDYFYTSPLVPVVDGLFVVEVQMGGSPETAIEFWQTVGDMEMYFGIGVGPNEGGPYEIFGERTKLGWSARAQHSGASEISYSLRFPYIDTHVNNFADPETMMSLHNEFGGTALELSSGVITNNATLLVTGASPLLDGFIDTGLVHINDSARAFGLFAIADQFPVVAVINSALSSNRAAVLGQVLSTANPNIVAVRAINSASGNNAALGTGDYAGDFSGDVLARTDLRVQGEPTRDYAFNSPSPIGPLAYGSVALAGNLNSGTANISVSWDAGGSQYIVSVMGESMNFSTHIVSITVVDTAEPRVATFTASGGNLLVKIWDINSGNIAVQDNFSIVIFDPTATTINRLAAPNGMDEDKYTEKTGVQLIQTEPRNEPVEPFENYGPGVTGD
ncbi:hypothetical protein COB72_05865 [bacterium]|nr:MAG: hypothetical protein COB72_05865 [bacterium]